MKDLFKEFLSLYYTKSRIERSRDIHLDTGIIARLEDISCNIYYLSNGNRINIPWQYIDLFSSLDVYCGARLEKIVIQDDIEKAMYLFFLLARELTLKNGKKFLNVLSAIFDNKEAIDTFRAWCLTEFDLKLEEITLYSLDKTVKI